MKRKLIFIIAVALTALLAAACGSIAAPAYEHADGSEDHAEVVAQEPTDSPTNTPTETPTTPPTAPPTSTPQPPTATPTDVPATEIPPTQVPAESAVSAEEERIAAAVDAADATEGQTLFTVNACSSCHHVASEDTLVGPGLMNVYNRAGSRVAGQGPNEYIFTSIRASQAFVVEGFAAGLMPVFTHLTDTDIYNLMAYLRTLHN